MQDVGQENAKREEKYEYPPLGYLIPLIPFLFHLVEPVSDLHQPTPLFLRFRGFCPLQSTTATRHPPSKVIRLQVTRTHPCHRGRDDGAGN